MTSDIKDKKKTDFISVLFKWKKMLIINMTIVTLIMVGVSFLFPVTYKAAAYVLPAPNSNSLGGLSSLVSNNSMLSVGAKLLGVGGSNDDDIILGLLHSKTVLTKIINKFDLHNYYEVSDRNIDKTIKAFGNNLYFDVNKFGFIEIGIENKNPQLCAEISNEFVKVVDSLNIYIKSTAARNQRIYIERRFLKNKEDLKKVEEQYHKFQMENGAFAVPEQVKASILAIAELEGELIQNESTLKLLKNSVSTSTPIVEQLQNKINAIKKQIKDLSVQSNNNLGVLHQLEKLPQLQLEYLRLYREIKIQNKILGFIYPLYEQAKLEEQKNTATLLVVEKATAPQLKYRPKKAFIVFLGFSFIFLIHMLLIARFNNLTVKGKNQLSEFENKEFEVYEKIKRFFRV